MEESLTGGRKRRDEDEGLDDIMIIQLLIGAGANSLLVNKDGWTPLHLACRQGDPAVVRCLLTLDSGPRAIRLVSKNGRSCLHTASLHGCHQAVRLLMNCGGGGLDVETRDGCGSTPLMDAVRGGHIALADLLVTRYGADPRATDLLGRQCAHLAAETGHVASLDWLIGGPIGAEALEARAKRGGTTALHLACKEGQTEVVRWCLERREGGSGAWAVDDAGRGPLHYAVGAQSAQCVTLLLSAGCVDCPDRSGQTARSLAKTELLASLFSPS